jgi:endonuclease/exonuclease/phosphatase family metal-dependent hydrolase
MTLPVRFVVCSYNIWTNTRWPERKEALQSFVRYHMPDILCLQELQADSKKALDEELLVTHQRVEDAFEGWTCEGNIYWNTTFFELVEYGAEQIGILEKFRRLFWVRLKLKDDSGRTIFVSTAHYTYQGHPVELETNQNSRVPQAHKTVEFLASAIKENEPGLFMGDLNDHYNPIRILEASGLVNCFRGLGHVPRFTHPATPTTVKGSPTTLDWMFHRGPLRLMNSEVVDFFEGDLAPSDHKPIIATYSL